MTLHNRHIIRNEFLDVQFYGSEEEGLQLQKRLSELNKHILPALMEKCLDEIDTSDQYISIDHIEVDLGWMDLEEVEINLSQHISDKVKEILLQKISSDPGVSLRDKKGKQWNSPQDHALEVLIYFLEHGHLSWNIQLLPNQSLESYITTQWPTAAVMESILNRLTSIVLHPTPQQRLIHQFSTTFVKRVLDHILLQYKEPIRTSQTVKQKIRLIQIAHLANSSNATSLSHSKNQDKKEIPDLNQNITARQPRQMIGKGEPIFIENSGLVLLHPFFLRLFEGLNIMKEDKLEDPVRAMAILHYLCTGGTSAPEYDLVLQKILCQIPISDTAIPPMEITENEIDEADTMLRAVIEHWTALRDTSVDGLRGTFLLRAGKLSNMENEGWLLEVETRTFDILLDLMPWSFSRIQLPWMTDMLHVQWDYQQLK